MRLVGGSTPSQSAPPNGLSTEQWENAKTIASVGKKLGVGARGIQIALMTAIVESGLRDLSYGDRDSVGVFQQRNAWGSYGERMNVAQSARMFFTGGHQGQRGLLDISGWNRMDPGRAAQAVQVSAFPDRYAQQSSKAQGILSSLHNTNLPTTYSPHSSTPMGGSLHLTDGMGAEVRNPPRASGPVGMPDPAGHPEPTVAMAAQSPPTPADKGPGGPLTSAYDKLIETAPQATGTEGVGEATALGAQASNEAQNTSMFKPDDDPDMDLSGLFTHNATAGNLGHFSSSSAPDAGVSGIRSSVLNYARSALGTPYVFGGNSPSQGMDCSGLIKWALEKAGVHGVPRLSARQAQWAGGYNKKANDLTNARAGDLITWGDGPDGAIMDHIAIYAGKGKIIEEPRTGLSARVIDIGNYYKNLYGGFHIVHMGSVYGD